MILHKPLPNASVYNYETLPYQINWKIAGEGQLENLTTEGHKCSFKAIFNGNTTIVILENGSKGVTKCSPEDEYSQQKGLEIAYLRASIKSFKKDLKGLTKQKETRI